MRYRVFAAAVLAALVNAPFPLHAQGQTAEIIISGAELIHTNSGIIRKNFENKLMIYRKDNTLRVSGLSNYSGNTSNWNRRVGGNPNSSWSVGPNNSLRQIHRRDTHSIIHEIRIMEDKCSVSSKATLHSGNTHYRTYDYLANNLTWEISRCIIRPVNSPGT